MKDGVIVLCRNRGDSLQLTWANTKSIRMLYYRRRRQCCMWRREEAQTWRNRQWWWICQRRGPTQLWFRQLWIWGRPRLRGKREILTSKDEPSGIESDLSLYIASMYGVSWSLLIHCVYCVHVGLWISSIKPSDTTKVMALSPVYGYFYFDMQTRILYI